MYAALKYLHVTCVVLSGSGFALQGWWMATRNPLLDHRATRIVPHVVDTVLLASAITLAVLSAQYPFVAPWLTAKVVGLVVYIALGLIALRFGRTMRTRRVALFAALLVFSWIVSVALTKNAAGFLDLTGVL